MIILFGLLASLGYSVQGTLLARYARSVDSLSLVAYRGLSLALTMWLLLLFVPATAFALPTSAILLLVVVACCWTGANFLSNIAVQSLTVGIATAFSIGSGTVVAMLIEGFVLGRPLSRLQGILVILLLLSVTALAAAKATGPVPERYDPRKGIAAGLGFGLAIGVTWILLGVLSQQYHPFIVGYLGETFVGFTALIAAVVRGRLIHGKGFEILPVPQMIRIGLCSAPTIVGTGAYAYALTLGPVAIPSAILGTLVALNSILAMFLYGEKLTPRQWACVASSAAILVALKLVGD